VADHRLVARHIATAFVGRGWSARSIERDIVP
jgi:hypothetical protein